jgi:UDP-N-acetyl-D-glucosamine dehydrogenase
MPPQQNYHEQPEIDFDHAVQEHLASPSKVTVIGNGYVGLPLCVLMKDCGHTVTGLDANKAQVERHNQGISTIDDVEDHELDGIAFTSDPTDIQDSDVYVICVPTPVTENKMPDLRYVNAVKQMLEKHAKQGALIILESTVGVGDTRRTFKDMCSRGFLVANSPERIDPARKVPTLQDVPKVVGGVNPESTSAASAFYSTVFTSVVPVRNSDHSEAVKLLENSYRAVNISFINEFADFCGTVDLNVNDVVDAAGTKPYGFSPFRSWIGVGGHCIPVDPHYLLGSDPSLSWPILSSSMDAMHSRPSKIAQARVSGSKKKLERVLVCGVSYKPNVSDTRDAPQSDFVRTLQENNVKVDYFDPLVETYQDLKRVEDLSCDVVDEYDQVFVMHKHETCRHALESLRGLPNVEFFE